MPISLPALLAILLLPLLTFTKADIQQVPNENLTHTINNTFYPPAVLKVRNQLLYISYPKVNSDVIINLESKAIEPNNSCRIVVPVPQDRDVLHTEARVLGNGQLLVSLVETSEADAGPELHFFAIDFTEHGCVSHEFSLDFDDEMLENNKPVIILPYSDTFDVFVKSRMHCKPSGSMCLIRFNVKGEQLGIKNFDFKTDDGNFDLTKLHPLREFNPDTGYVLVSMDMSSLRLLDADLRVIRRKRIPGYVRANSVLNSVIGVCHHSEADGPGWSSTQCSWLDSRFKPRARASLASSPAQYAVRIYNLADGGALMLEISRRGIDARIRRLTADGRISQPVEYSYDCDNHRAEPLDWFVELKARVYCFSYMCLYKAITHCVDLTDAPELADFE